VHGGVSQEEVGYMTKLASLGHRDPGRGPVNIDSILGRFRLQKMKGSFNMDNFFITALRRNVQIYTAKLIPLFY